jgi:predicted phage baseplate assembly protein
MSHASAPAFPVVISNPPGLSAINYRVGDYTSFRDNLLQNLPGEVELKGWRPADDGGDLALQLLEWWAYVADILTFYNERIANRSYLGTAVLQTLAQTPPAAGSSGAAGLPDDPTLIAQVAGFRTSPGLAATGQIALLVNSKTSISLPPLFAVQSKPGPGQQPQVFEAANSADTYSPTDSGGAVPVDLSCPTVFSATGVTTIGNPDFVSAPAGPLLKGSITSIKAGDLTVVAQIAPPLSNASSFAVTVETVTTETDPRGRTNTRLAFGSFVLPSSFVADVSPDVTSCQALRSIQSAPTYAFDNTSDGAAQTAPAVSGLTPGVGPTGVHLASLVRDIAVGDLIVLGVVDTAAASPAAVTYVTAGVIDYQETIWYANASNPATAPQTPPVTPENVVPIPIPHTFLTLEANVLANNVGSTQTVARVWYGFHTVSALLDEMPSAKVTASGIANYIVQPAGAPNTTATNGAVVLIEGADGLGATATLTSPPPEAPASIGLASSDVATLTLPLRLLYNVVNVTTGKTVTNEVLGNGDATVASQSFTLQKSPLTYLKSADPSSPTSTLTVMVDNVAWAETPNFNNQASDAKVFVTQQDKNQNTTVTFGDGIKGARLATGTGNVTATYRYGSGPGDPSLGGPAPTTLVTILTPYPGLGSVRNPVPMTGGAAPSTPAQVQQSAPSSALALRRAISASDYEAIAAQAPSVTRARARVAWDPKGRRSVLTVSIGGGPDAVAETQAALATAADPNRQVLVGPATEVDLQLSLVVSYDPSVDPSDVQSGVVAALADPVAGLFSASQSQIGEPLYDSQIYAACQKVAGVRAVRGLIIRNVTNLAPQDFAAAPLLTGVVHAPGADSFFALAPSAVDVTLETGNG